MRTAEFRSKEACNGSLNIIIPASVWSRRIIWHILLIKYSAV